MLHILINLDRVLGPPWSPLKLILLFILELLISKTSNEAPELQASRPISLLNVNLKILETVLSTHVKKYPKLSYS